MYCAMPPDYGGSGRRLRRLPQGLRGHDRRGWSLRLTGSLIVAGQPAHRARQLRDVAGEVGTHRARVDLVGLAPLADVVGVVELAEPEPAVHDDRVALAQRLHHVVAELPPTGHGHEDRVRVDP